MLNWEKYFSLGIFQNYLVFIPAKSYIKYFSGANRTELWKCNRISAENMANITKSDTSFATAFVNHLVLPDINFSFLHTNSMEHRNSNTDFILKICLFGSLELTKNANLDKYRYNRYGIGTDSR